MIRRLSFAFALAFLLPLTAMAEEKPSPELSEAEREELIEMMESSRKMFLDLILGLSDEQWNFKQNPDRWSTGQCAEHIVRSQRALLDRAKEALAADFDPDWYERTKGKNELIRQVMPNRRPMGQGGATAPEEIRPTEDWGKAQVIEEFHKVYGEALAIMETFEKPARAHTVEHPFPVFNWLSAYDWMIYVPLHTVRHSRQIIEVQEDENYPKE